MIELTYANYKTKQDEVREQLNKFTQKNGISIYNLARLLNLSYETVKCFMVDNRIIRYNTMCKIVDLLNQNLEE